MGWLRGVGLRPQGTALYWVREGEEDQRRVVGGGEGAGVEWRMGTEG